MGHTQSDVILNISRIQSGKKHTIMEGQISDEEFRTLYPNAQIYNSTRRAITRYGKSTYNYWRQHQDYSWTNYDCKTIDSFRV